LVQEAHLLTQVLQTALTVLCLVTQQRLLAAVEVALTTIIANGRQAQAAQAVGRRITTPPAPQHQVKASLVVALQHPQVMVLVVVAAQEPQVRLEQPLFVVLVALDWPRQLQALLFFMQGAGVLVQAFRRLQRVQAAMVVGVVVVVALLA
jgi:hypothetical protein